ncbi:hypothetical protein DL95DRAFT_512468 [Leptodontidium sp. 2 PMI_412]|nr:hypothetical protein DL95DRAFT_512468 [Leptodontidium sp. 2 PMI_412]
MTFLATLLRLATAASAIDVYFHFDRSDCQGRSAVCTNLNPDTCCGVPTGSVPSLGFRDIPTNWFLQVRGHEGGGCRLTKTLETASFTNFKCLGNGPYTGAGYGFLSRKTVRGTEGVEIQAAEKCTLPDLLVLEDESKYSLSGLEEAKIVETLAVVKNAADGEALDDAVKGLEKVE